MARPGDAPGRPARHDRRMTSFYPRFYDTVLALGERRGMRERRRALLAETSGRVLEIGAGTGLNLDLYPDAVTELVASEPDDRMRGMLRRRAVDGVAVSDAGAEALPFEDDSFDFAVSTMVLCTVPDPMAALAEVHRVLKPGGRLLFIEHIRADSPRLARWQDRLERPWRAIGDGCRCNQPTLGIIDRSGLAVERVERYRWRGMPAIVHPLATGAAVAR
jgi:ubiquinone/menaquinone biosynthesis C-methylase UbiE